MLVVIVLSFFLISFIADFYTLLRFVTLWPPCLYFDDMALSPLLLVPLLSVGFSSVGSVPDDPAAYSGLGERLREMLAQHDLSAGDALLDAFFERLLASEDPGTRSFAKLVGGVRSKRTPVVTLNPAQVEFHISECRTAVKERQGELMTIYEGQGRDSDDGGSGGCREASGGCGPEVAFGVSSSLMVMVICFKAASDDGGSGGCQEASRGCTAKVA